MKRPQQSRRRPAEVECGLIGTASEQQRKHEESEDHRQQPVPRRPPNQRRDEMEIAINNVTCVELGGSGRGQRELWFGVTRGLGRSARCTPFIGGRIRKRRAAIAPSWRHSQTSCFDEPRAFVASCVTHAVLPSSNPVRPGATSAQRSSFSHLSPT